MNAFADVLRAQTGRKGVTVGKLCEGLCSRSMFTRICNGERTANKLLRERLMHRMGLSDTRNESFLFRDEYSAWKHRQQILDKINREQFDKAEELLKKYRSGISDENNLEQQFCIVMELQILIGQGKGKEETTKMVEKALKLTVPNIDIKPLGDLMLSEQEIDLIIEYIRYCHPKNMSRCCDELLAYINNSFFDEYIQAKILPKIVFFQCESELKKASNVDWEKLLRNCDKAIRCLRDTQRLYYLWELLGVREEIYHHMEKRIKKSGQEQYLDSLNQAIEKNGLWKQTLEKVYKDCEMNPAMTNNCYLYLQKNVFCINDILCGRRHMLGMTRRELVENICSEKTIARAELTNGKMQMPIMREVLEKLGMSGEYQKVDVITTNPEAMDILRNITKYGYDRNYVKEQEELEKLEKMIPMDNPINRQYIRKANVLLMHNRGEISSEEALQGLKEALEYTISLENIWDGKGVCLTRGELTCLTNMAFIQGTKKLNSYHSLLWRICERYEQEGEIYQNISMYEFVMAHIASVLGNAGEYEKSNAISKIIISENVRARRFGNIADGIYNMAYNYKHQKASSYKEDVWRAEVKRSAVLFHMARCYRTEKILMENILPN